MAYKSAFFILLASIFLGDLIIPVVSTIIYSVSAGIPGWSIYEFIMFQGTLIIVIGLWHCLFAGFLGEIIHSIDQGTFEKILLKPFPSLALVTANNFDADGIAEVVAGIAIVTYALFHLQFSWIFFIPYLFLILLGVFFEYSLTVIAGALAFTYVKTWRLFELINLVEKFVRYPLDIYGGGMRFFLTFLMPAALASYYPAAILLQKISLASIFILVIPVTLFFGLALLIWHFSIRKYSSAGG
jgi:ABC-2 type transport system permease protein